MNEKDARRIIKVNNDTCGCGQVWETGHDDICETKVKAEEFECKYETPWHLLIGIAEGYLKGIRKADTLKDTLNLAYQLHLVGEHIHPDILKASLDRWEESK